MIQLEQRLSANRSITTAERGFDSSFRFTSDACLIAIKFLGCGSIEKLYVVVRVAAGDVKRKSLLKIYAARRIERSSSARY